MHFRSYFLLLMTMAVMSACGLNDPSPLPAGELAVKVEELSKAEEPTLAKATVPDTGVAGDPKAAQASLKDLTVLAQLRSLALRVSSVAGVTAPATMRVVVGADNQAAEKILSGARINDHGPVFVITMTGGPFTSVHHPPGVPAPQGDVLTLTVDAATHRVTHIGFVNAEPDLDQIGPGAINLAQ